MSSQTTIMEITSEDAARRADNFLFAIFKNVPKTRVYRAIRKGEVRINKKRIKPDYKLKIGDQVRIPPIYQPEQAPPVQPSSGLVDLLKQSILYEDDKMLVINKPSGIAVHGGSGIKLGVIEALRTMYPKLEMELAHRLDRDTSGCLLVAKKRSAVRDLHAQLRESRVKKIYQCLVRGKLSKSTVTVDRPLFKNQVLSGERVVKIDEERGKPSITIFSEMQQFNEASLLRAELKTGRTHQIRVHALSLGCPLAGDSKYGDDVFSKKMRDLGLNRLFLHAAEVTFHPPGQEQRITVNAPMDQVLLATLDQLSKQ